MQQPKKRSTRAIKRIVAQLNRVILSWGEGQRIKKDSLFISNKLPPLYQIMVYQGEAILLQRFFGQIRKRIAIEQSHQDYLQFWHHCTEQHGFILDFISRTAWLSVLQINTAIRPLSNAEAKSLYCILLAVIAEHQPNLLSMACDEIFVHLYKQQFPEQGKESKTQAIEQLRHKLRHQLRHLTQSPCEIRESFVQHSEQVDFSLLYRVQANANWRLLVQVQRPRLKTARLVAYQQALAHDLSQILHNHA